MTRVRGGGCVWGRGRGRGRGRGESGFTVVEVSMAGGLLVLVLSTLLSMLSSQTAAERRVRANVDNQEDVRFALVAMARDIRAADPLLPLASITDYSNKVEVHLKGSDGNTIGYYRWVFDPVASTLSRHTLSGPGGTVTGTTYKVNRVRNADAGVPLFRYFNSLGTELSAATATTGDFANCTVRVHIALHADAMPGPLPFTSESDAELRNRLPGGIGC